MAKRNLPQIIEVSKRIYTTEELEHFHKSIQKFWREERINEDGKPVRKFDWDEMAVAYGAFVKVPGSNGAYNYAAAVKFLDHGIMTTPSPTRHEQLANLWEQYQYWIGRRENRRESSIVKSLNEMAEQEFSQF